MSLSLTKPLEDPVSSRILLSDQQPLLAFSAKSGPEIHCDFDLECSKDGKLGEVSSRRLCNVTIKLQGATIPVFCHVVQLPKEFGVILGDDWLIQTDAEPKPRHRVS